MQLVGVVFTFGLDVERVQVNFRAVVFLDLVLVFALDVRLAFIDYVGNYSIDLSSEFGQFLVCNQNTVFDFDDVVVDVFSRPISMVADQRFDLFEKLNPVGLVFVTRLFLILNRYKCLNL